jgi:hypothetical protein
LGVSYTNKSKKWVVKVYHKGSEIYLGSFEKEETAREVFKKHNEKYKRLFEKEKLQWEKREINFYGR